MSYEIVLIALSLFGAWAVTEEQWARCGYESWMISNSGWIAHFASQGEVYPALLFAAYFVLAVKGRVSNRERNELI